MKRLIILSLLTNLLLSPAQAGFSFKRLRRSVTRTVKKVIKKPVKAAAAIIAAPTAAVVALVTKPKETLKKPKESITNTTNDILDTGKDLINTASDTTLDGIKEVGEGIEDVAEPLADEVSVGGGIQGNSDGEISITDSDGNPIEEKPADPTDMTSDSFDWEAALRTSREQELTDFLKMENSIDSNHNDGPLKTKEEFLALQNISNSLLENADQIALGNGLLEDRLNIAKDLLLLAENIRAAGIGSVSQEKLLKFVEEFFEKNANFREISSMTALGSTLGTLILPGPGTLIGALIGAGITVWSIEQIYNAFNKTTNEDSLSVEEISDKIAHGHSWKKHRADFPELKNEEEFSDFIEDIINNSSDKKILQDGREGFWDDESETVVVVNPNAADKGTSFRPHDGKNYFDNILR